MQLIQAASGFLVRRTGTKSPLLGTCFAYRLPNYLLTAAHCVKDVPQDEIGVAMLSDDDNDEGLDVEEVISHPRADLAVVRISPWPSRIFEPFWNIEGGAGWGDEFVAYGFPEDTTLEGPRPTPRMFRGYIQRVLVHTSHLGYTYVAAELSIGAPGGLSGGPVCWTRDPSKVLGVVTENLESSTFLAAVEEKIQDGSTVRHETRNMINYGLAEALLDTREWLEEVIPD